MTSNKGMNNHYTENYKTWVKETEGEDVNK